MTPAISVIVPVYNVEKYVGQCLQSIIDQTFNDLEIICVFTEGNDNSLQILRKFAAADDRIKIICRNDGALGGARNTGMDHATGRYFLFVDSDDYLEKDACQKLYDLAEANKSDMAFCAIATLDNNTGIVGAGWNSRLPFPAKLEKKVFAYSDLAPDVFISDNAPVPAWNKLYNSQFIAENNLRFPENIRWEDNPFYYEALARAQRLVYTNEQLYIYRINRENSLQNVNKLRFSDYKILKIFRAIYDKLLACNVGQPYLDAFTAYLGRELLWRSQAQDVIQRRFLYEFADLFPELKDAIFAFLEKNGISGEIIRKSKKPLALVSVIIPCHNCEPYIGQALDSILAQTIKDIEIICVDDCSTDSTLSILEQYAKENPNIKILRHKTNLGPGAARDLALKIANGVFLYFLDADDLMPNPDTFEKMIAAIKKYGIRTACGNIACFENDDTGYLLDYSGQNFKIERIYEYWEYNVRPVWGFTRFLFDQEIVIKNNINFGDFIYYEDPYFFARYMQAAHVFVALPVIVYLYRQHKKDHLLSAAQLDSYFDAEAEIFAILKDIDEDLFAAEAHIFQGFVQQAKVCATGDEQKALLKKANSLSKKFHAQRYANTSTGNPMKKLLKKCLSPFYRPCRDRLYNLMLNASQNSIRALDKKSGLLADRIVEISQAVETIQRSVASLEKTLCGIAENGSAIEALKTHGLSLAGRQTNNSNPSLCLIGVDEYGDPGKAASYLGQKAFLNYYFPQHKIICYSPEYVANNLDALKGISNDNNIIFLSLENLDAKDSLNGNLLSRIVREFKKNRIIIFNWDIRLKDHECSRACASHPVLILFCNGKSSLEQAKRDCPHAASFLMPDCALFLKYYRGDAARTGIGIYCADIDDMRSLGVDQSSEIITAILQKNNADLLNPENGNRKPINVAEARIYLQTALAKFAAKKIIVTNSLHGLIFSLLANTPCIVLKGHDGKTDDFYQSFCVDIPHIFYAGLNLIEVEKILNNIDNQQINYNNLFEPWFAEMHDIIVRYI